MVRDGVGGFAVLAEYLLKTGGIFAIICGRKEVVYCN